MKIASQLCCIPKKRVRFNYGSTLVTGHACILCMYAHPLCASERWLLLPSGLLPAYWRGVAGLESLQRLASVDMN